MRKLQPRRSKPANRFVMYATFILVLGSCSAPLAIAQTRDCSDGIVTLPMGVNGTIQICSGLSSSAPTLERQLNQIAKTQARQQQTIDNLHRLLVSVNSVSSNFDLKHQSDLLQSLSAQLAAAQLSGQQQSQIASLAEQLDSVKKLLISELQNAKTSRQANAALNGPVGDAISELDLPRAQSLLEDIRSQLKSIDRKLDTLQQQTAASATNIDNKLDQQSVAITCGYASASLTVGALKAHMLDRVSNNMTCHPEIAGEDSVVQVIAKKFDDDTFPQERAFLEGLWKIPALPTSAVCPATSRALSTSNFDGLAWLFAHSPRGTVEACDGFPDLLVASLFMPGKSAAEVVNQLTASGFSRDFDNAASYRVAYAAWTKFRYRGYLEASQALAPSNSAALQAARDQAELHPGSYETVDSVAELCRGIMFLPQRSEPLIHACAH